MPDPTAKLPELIQSLRRSSHPDSHAIELEIHILLPLVMDANELLDALGHNCCSPILNNMLRARLISLLPAVLSGDVLKRSIIYGTQHRDLLDVATIRLADLLPFMDDASLLAEFSKILESPTHLQFAIAKRIKELS